MTKMLRAALAAVALLAFAIACDTGEDSQPVGSDDTAPRTRQVEPGSATPATKTAGADSPTPTPNVVRAVKWSDGWPVPPLPVMWLEHESGPIPGSPHTYYWQFEGASDPVFKEYKIWSGVREYAEVDPGSSIPIKIDADTRPSKMFAKVFTRTGNIMAGGLMRLSTTSPELDLADVGPGVYNVRLTGHWHDNRVSYEFGLSIPGAANLKSQCEKTTIGGYVNVVLESLDDQLRTAMDSLNGGGCRFSKPIARVTMKLQNKNFGPYTETFRIDPPSISVSFPLKNGLASEKSGAPLPPGPYSRQIVVIAEDGNELDISRVFRDVVTLAAP